jgi:hypothetical protein
MEIANKFNDFFHNKVMNLKLKLPPLSSQFTLPFSEPDMTRSTLTSFQLATQSEVANLLKRSPKSSNLNDPLPPWLLAKCIPQILPVITHLVNWSLLHGMPRIYKRAIVLPLLKKPTLNKEDLGNYRPVSKSVFCPTRPTIKQIRSVAKVTKVIEQSFGSKYESETKQQRISIEIQSFISNTN